MKIFKLLIIIIVSYIAFMYGYSFYSVNLTATVPETEANKYTSCWAEYNYCLNK